MDLPRVSQRSLEAFLPPQPQVPNGWSSDPLGQTIRQTGQLLATRRQDDARCHWYSRHTARRDPQ